MKETIREVFPDVNEAEIQQLLDKTASSDSHKIVVLDDDPTGVQTVHGVSVYTDWSLESIRHGFEEKEKLFYILTNSRSFTEEKTAAVHREIGRSILQVSKELGKEFVIISRGDSTLRGHYPLETETLKEVLEQEGGGVIDGEIICPYFKEGGRFTIDDVHYVRMGDELVPAGETEFAEDKTFGYKSSHLKDYIEEKTKGKYKRGDVRSISLKQLRAADLKGIEACLMSVNGFGKIIVNAVDACDLKIFCIALYEAMRKGKKFLFRTAAGFVKELGAVSSRELLRREEMIQEAGAGGKGGLILIGSHTKKTSEQLECLREVKGIEFIPLNSHLVLNQEELQKEAAAVTDRAESCIREGVTVAVYTRRELLVLEDDTPEQALERSVKISEAVQSIAAGIKTPPAFIVAKGGITSSDVGTKALEVKRATVLGQIKPGVPVWRTGSESRFPQMPYVIFPGNVGEKTTLKEAVQVLIG